MSICQSVNVSPCQYVNVSMHWQIFCKCQFVDESMCQHVNALTQNSVNVIMLTSQHVNVSTCQCQCTNRKVCQCQYVDLSTCQCQHVNALTEKYINVSTCWSVNTSICQYADLSMSTCQCIDRKVCQCQYVDLSMSTWQCIDNALYTYIVYSSWANLSGRKDWRITAFIGSKTESSRGSEAKVSFIYYLKHRCIGHWPFLGSRKSAITKAWSMEQIGSVGTVNDSCCWTMIWSSDMQLTKHKT